MSDPRDLSYKVSVWKIETYEGKRGKTYRVRWAVDGRPFKEPFKNYTQAERFQGQMFSAQGRGEAFSITRGLPVSMLRTERPEETWFSFACRYADHVWKRASAKHRGNVAFALMMATRAMLATERGKPDAAVLRAALRRWAFSKTYRDSVAMPPDVCAALEWVSRNTRNVSELSDTKLAAALVEAATTTIEGEPVAASSRLRYRAILKGALKFAVAEGLLGANPLDGLRGDSSSASIHQVDRRCVVNPAQAHALLEAVRDYGYEETAKRTAAQKSGPRLVAFFAAMYYSALRPEEAVNLCKHNLALPCPVQADDAASEEPTYDWGWIYLEQVTPDARPEFTDDGTSRDTRNQLKQREKGVTRPVPCPPELTRLLWEHMERFGTDSEGRLFTGIHGLPLATITYRRAWAWARTQALTEAEQASPLAARPYDLRHATVSTWLNEGVSETLVAQWAGHSVAVLKRIYAKCLVGEEERAKVQIAKALRRR